MPRTDWIAAFKDDVWGIVKAPSAEYAKSGTRKISSIRPTTSGNGSPVYAQAMVMGLGNQDTAAVFEVLNANGT